MNPIPTPARPSRTIGFVGFAVVALLLVAGGMGFYRKKGERVRKEQHQLLAAIGALKSGQIQRWRMERRNDARRAARGPLFRQRVGEYLRNPDSLTYRNDLLEQLRINQMTDVYASVQLLALDGRLLLSTEAASTPMNPATQRAIRAAAATPDPVFSDFFRGATDTTFLDVVMAVRNPEGQPLALVSLRSNADAVLFPVIREWPLPSDSGETVLTIRSGDEAMVPHRLRAEAAGAPPWHEPLTRTSLTSVQVVLGRRGYADGRDYRSKEVMADLRAIPDSDWFLTSKIDKEEVFGPLHSDALFITTITGAFILLAGAAFAYSYRRRQAKVFKALYELEQRKVDVERSLHTSEARLLQATERLSLATRAGGVGIWDWDVPQNSLVWDEQMFRLYGIIAEQFSGAYEAWKAGLHPEDLTRGDAEIQMALRGEKAFDTEFRVIWPDRTVHTLRGLATVQRDASGQPIRMIGTNWDITQQKLAEVALKASEKILLQSQSIAGLGSYMLDLATGRWTSSEVLNGIFGIDGSHDHSVENWAALIHPEWRETMTRYFAEEVVGRGGAFDKEYKIVRAEDGVERWVHGLGELEFNPQGLPVRMLGTIMDITVRKQAEEALHHSEQKFRTLFENLTEGVAIHELVRDDTGTPVDYRILAVNPAYQFHTGLEAATAKGRRGSELYGAARPPFLEEYARVALGGEPFTFETFFPPLGKHFRISVVSPKYGHFATVFEDITDRKRREEELKQKNAEMERFTYMISHDLKSPLVTIRTFLGYLEQDLEQGKAERVAKDMGFIRDATGKMTRLLDDLLEVSRVGRVVNPPVRVSLADLIREALIAVAGAIATRGVEIQIQVPPLTLTGDRPRLEEIWQNLVENAVKYMGDQPAPRIEFGAVDAGAETEFFVRDNGLGIDPRFHDKVFGLFEQLDPANDGTGLGLALVKRIIELYEGRIWLESEGLGRGTCFRFTLPLAMKNTTQGAGL